MFFCFGKKIYDTHWSENLLINCFGVQGYFFSKSDNRIHQLFVKAMVVKFTFKFIKKLRKCLKKGSSQSQLTQYLLNRHTFLKHQCQKKHLADSLLIWKSAAT